MIHRITKIIFSITLLTVISCRETNTDKSTKPIFKLFPYHLAIGYLSKDCRGVLLNSSDQFLTTNSCINSETNKVWFQKSLNSSEKQIIDISKIEKKGILSLITLTESFGSFYFNFSKHNGKLKDKAVMFGDSYKSECTSYYTGRHYCYSEKETKGLPLVLRGTSELVGLHVDIRGNTKAVCEKTGYCERRFVPVHNFLKSATN